LKNEKFFHAEFHVVEDTCWFEFEQDREEIILGENHQQSEKPILGLPRHHHPVISTSITTTLQNGEKENKREKLTGTSNSVEKMEESKEASVEFESD